MTTLWQDLRARGYTLGAVVRTYTVDGVQYNDRAVITPTGERASVAIDGTTSILLSLVVRADDESDLPITKDYVIA